MAFKLLRYYKNSLKRFLLYVTKFFKHYLYAATFAHTKGADEITLIDTFFLVDKIKETENFSDPYFPGLAALLSKRKVNYAYLPVFYSSKPDFDLSKVVKILKDKNIPVLSEYQLLSFTDLARLLCFILLYPFRVLRFARTIDKDSHELGLLRSELIDTIDQVTFLNFSRYLQGEKIAKLPYKKIKIISWYENQVIDKNLYKGLRVNMQKGRAKIYGAQLFLSLKSELNALPDENEEAFDIVPDKIIVNGPQFVPKDSRLHYAIGPSLRYSRIFSNSVGCSAKQKILVLLPHYAEDTRNLLRTLLEANIPPENISIKPHPATPISAFKELLPSGAMVTDEDIYELFKTAKMIVSTASGVLMEAASMGIPAISVKGVDQLEHHPLPELGRGIIWEEAGTAEDLRRQIDKLELILKDSPDKIRGIADEYRKMFFCEPTEENIIKAFEL